MATRTGKVILARGINLDKDYVNILDYTESQMVTLVTTNKVAEATNCSFLRPGENVIDMEVPYGTALQANYIAFQNPDYSNKWFFAFIDEAEYISNSVTRFHYTIDECSTWFDYWDPQACFVVREHTNDDTVGANTYPENLETGEYICNEHYKDSTMDSYATDLCYIMASTSLPVAGEAKDTVASSNIYNGIYTGLTYFRYDSSDPIDIILEIFANYAKTDAINGLFMAPKWLAPLHSGSSIREVQPSNSPATFNISVAKQTTLNGYHPFNQKLKCFPYNYLLVSNNVGQNIILHYEKFSTIDAGFIVRGVLNPGCSISITPLNYNGATYSDNDSIFLGKFPICNFQNDMYTNWLTQNSINILGQTVTSDDINIAGATIGGVSGIATSLLSGNMVGAGLATTSAIAGISGAVMQQKQHNMISPTVNGQLNSADVNVASGNNTFHFYKMSIRAEYAAIIDDFMSHFGYKTCRVKIPNQTGRRYWNYVQIGDGESIGYHTNTSISVPSSSMETINSVYRRGVTIWHDHANIGDYTLYNTTLS